MASRQQDSSDEQQLRELIKTKAQSYSKVRALRELSVEDLEQQMWEWWYVLGIQFDHVRGDIVTFADVLFNNQFKNLIVAQRAAKRDHRLCTRSLDEPVDVSDETDATLHDVYDADEYFEKTGGSIAGSASRRELSLDLHTVLNGLPANLRELAIRRSTQTITQAAAEMGISRETAHVWQRRVREEFRKAGLQDYLVRPSRK